MQQQKAHLSFVKRAPVKNERSPQEQGKIAVLNSVALSDFC